MMPVRASLSLLAAALLLGACAQTPTSPPAAAPANPVATDKAAADKPVADKAHEPKAPAIEAKVVPPEPKGTVALSVGIDAYENGKFAQAAKTIQLAIDQGLTEADQVRAHKLLAFMHCIAGRDAACRASFARALKIDPRMDLSPAEAGHPIWGPIFRSVKQAGGDGRK